MINRIRDEGLNRSQVMATVTQLTDVIGPRLTGSPQMKEANEWTRRKLEEWGLSNAHLEPFDFGRGWSFSHASVHMVAPHQTPLIALPQAWTPGTGGPKRGKAMRITLESEKDFDAYRGKLAGTILLLDPPRDLLSAEEPALDRYEDDELAELASFPIRGERGPGFRQRFMQRWRFRQKLNDFLVQEKVLATVSISSRDGGLVRVGGRGSREVGANVGVPALVMTAEHYNWLARLAGEPAPAQRQEDGGERNGGEATSPPAQEPPAQEPPAAEVELEIDVRARFHDDDLMAYNTIAEIPGSDPQAGVVMVGGHLDSWHGGTGATDNASSCAVAMEAVRILKAIGATPRRTIRIALWSGEEQGLLGSRAYVEEHFAHRPLKDDPEQRDLPAWLREPAGPIEIKPGHADLSAYFNLDNGSGRIRGIYAQENVAVTPIFRAWLEPFHDLGATTVATRNTGGTDHLSFDRVGLPGFQFIQDGLDYSTRTHHTNMDVLDHVPREDLIQSSVILASFLYHAAMREEPLPRKPMPQEEE
ncbi:MAG: M20/M25/M40 family metallo-hydrolase [Acidobacteria bacterium]|nr:MAG: M20/M25/M40 family metallo-hydrolase [Acidobacteriota bacterium]